MDKSIVPFVIIVFTVMMEVIIIAFYAWMLWWMHHLSSIKCACALSWRNKFMQVWFSLAIALYFVRFFLIKSPIILDVLMLGFLIGFIIVTRQFVNKVREDKNCKCANTDTLRVLDIFNYIQIVIVMLISIALVFTIVSGRTKV